MVAFWYLLVLAPFIVIPIVWWNYRRKLAEREQIAGARWGSLVREVEAPQGDRGLDGPASVAAVATSPAIAAQYAPRERVLDPAQTVLYYLLKSGLADHEIMPMVALGCLLSVPAEPAGSEREQRLRALARETVDFLVCNKSMKPVAVVDLLAQEAPAALTTAPDFRTRCLAHSGIRHLRLVRGALPKREEVRGLVLGP